MPIPRPRPASPIDGFHFKDNFFSRDTTVTTGNIGLQGWEFTTIANASTISFPTGTGSQWGTTELQDGVLRLVTASTADGDGTALHMLPDQVVMPGTDNGGGFAFRAKLNPPQIAGNNFRIGVDDSVTATDPDNGILLNSTGGVMTLETFSAGQGDVALALAQPASRTLTSGTTMQIDVWHAFEVTWGGANGQGGPRLVQCFVDGDTDPSAELFCNLDDDEDFEFKMCHFNLSGGALAVSMDIDYYEVWNWHDYNSDGRIIPFGA